MVKEQRGFTLVGMLVTLAITGIIIGVLGAMVNQVVAVTDYGGEKMTALHELQNVSHWLVYDGQRAYSATGGNELVLTIPNEPEITYTLAGTELHRISDGSQMTLARYISALEFTTETSITEAITVTMAITSSPPGRSAISEQAEYQVVLRVSPPEEEGGG